jgi:hypothetical protein
MVEKRKTKEVTVTNRKQNGSEDSLFVICFGNSEGVVRGREESVRDAQFIYASDTLYTFVTDARVLRLPGTVRAGRQRLLPSCCGRD